MEEFLRAVADLNVTLDKDFREIVLALAQELPFDVIKDMIHNGNPDEGFLKDQEWAIVLATCLKFDRLDVFEMLLDEGVKPDLVIPGQFMILRYDTVLLQTAVATRKYAMVELLLRRNANVNTVLEHSHKGHMYPPMHCWSINHITHCRSIMCPVFSNDDPEMMKLLLEGYDQSCNWDGKCTLYMACRKRAVKCALSLVKNQQYKEHVNLSDTLLYQLPLNKATLLPILYDMGVKEGIYTPDDLGKCLNADAKKSYLLTQEPCIAGDIELLLSLGAPVNFKVNGQTPLDVLIQPIIVINHNLQKALFGYLPKAVSLLFHHGAKVQFRFVNCFLFSSLITAMLIHKHKHPELLEEALDFFFKMIFLFRKNEFSKHILGSQSPSPSPTPNHKGFEMFLGKACHKKHCESTICRSDCSSLLGAFRVCLLDLDEIGFVIAYTLYNSVRYPSSGICSDRCDCQSLFACTLMCLWPHKEHQEYIQMLHDSVSKDQCAKICQHFPFDRSLKDLA